ncbi:ABC transporter ATP-binding protein [Jiangella muralis]|uniref:ABC transporter ATP-binding protein n=1 Tax=Jiangella muralis TaxID=702383 RepID=UPI00069E3B92|nr:ABC transporter ATP-binding protein [Jiangella muralis]
MTLLTAERLRLSYGAGAGRHEVLRGVDLQVSPAEIVALVGESGCGKSSLARSLVGLQDLDDGQVRYDGRDVHALGRRRRDRELLTLQLVFQSASACLNPRRTIGSQVADGRDGAPRLRTPEVATVLEQVGLAPSFADRRPDALSGGQRQRAAIAAALTVNPRLLVLDEPFAALDASAQAQLANLLLQLRQEQEMALLVISHDLGIVRQVADRCLVMREGSIVEEGPTEQLWRAPQHEYTRRLLDSIPGRQRAVTAAPLRKVERP